LKGKNEIAFHTRAKSKGLFLMKSTGEFYGTFFYPSTNLIMCTEAGDQILSEKNAAF